MEAFLYWLFSNLGWEGLKKSLPKAKQKDLQLFKQALEDAQNRNRELEKDRALLEKIVRQRNIALEELRKANAEIASLKKELANEKKNSQ